MNWSNDMSDNAVTNHTEATPMAEIIKTRLNRREVVQGGLTAAAGFLVSDVAQGQQDPIVPMQPGLMDFTPLAIRNARGPWPSISEDYEFSVLIPWGDPIVPDGPKFSYPPTPENQEQQIGIGHDGMWFFPSKDEFNESRKGLLALNHEFGSDSHLLGKGDPESLEDVRVSQHAHGVSVVGLVRTAGVWQTYDACEARRIHVNTPVAFSGPAAGSALLQTPNGNAPAGTVNNCGCGVTPWNTYLTCEENFQGYFGATNQRSTWIATDEQSRYGFSSGGFGYGWQNFDRRFDLSDSGYRNEENRFGWVVEIDPYDANQTPVKRTALGRFKHESVACAVGKDRRVVAYMGDDQGNDYIYKFVSDEDHVKLRHEGKSPLDEGKLFVARFDEDGTGEWLELSVDNPVLASRFQSQAAVVTYARLAADAVGATPMDRPEWTTVAANGTVFCACTNNGGRSQPNAANPQAPNNHGHIISWVDSDMHVGTTFTWDIFLLSSDTHATDARFADPDAIYVDPDGRLFVLTDGEQRSNMTNQVVVIDTVTKAAKRLFAGVFGDEVTGITMTPDRRTMFVNLQHVGGGDIRLTDFPRLGDPVPRDATIVITRKDGGIVGS